MAMIRGRKLQSKTIQELELEQARKNLNSYEKKIVKPLASLKEQRRLTAYNVTQHPHNSPIDDPDPYYVDKKTFIFLSKQRMIFRFSEEKSLFLFGKHSRVRLAFLRVLVHQWFNYLVIGTIILNCGVMMVNGNNKPEWSELYVENIFLFIYTTEAVVKIVGRGFILHPFSYLRDPWNWLDFVVIVAGFYLIILDHVRQDDTDVGSLTFLRAIRVLRIFKTVSVIPGLRMIVSALIASTKALKDAMLLSLLGFSMFSLIGIQVFRGTLKSKCILRPPWMIERWVKCRSGIHGGNATESPQLDIPLRSNRQDTECSFEDMFGQQIRQQFGPRQLQEMKYLSEQWAHGSSSGSGSTTDDDLVSLVPTTVTTPLSNISEGFSGHESGSSDVSWDAEIISNWTYRIPKVDLFNTTGYVFDWEKWINDERHYVTNNFQPVLCGNVSNAAQCGDLSMCIKAGKNPNFDYTSFDNFPFAFLSVFRLSLQDNWEELYLQVLETSGHLAVLFFLIMIFLGSYYLVNLILAVVASSYEDQRKSVELALAEEKRVKLQEKAFLKDQRNSTTKFRSMNKRCSKGNIIQSSCRVCEKFKKIFLQWTCCVGNGSLCVARDKLKKVFMHPNAELVVVSLVILNTLVMAMEHEPKEAAFVEFLDTSNVVFNTLFTIEMVGKMLALSPYHYFSVTWNTFDFIVVTLSLVEMMMAGGLDGMAVLRTFRLIRLVRILKLAKSWPTLSKIMSMIADSLSKLGYLTVVLLIVLIIFALAGMQTVGAQFFMDESRGIPLRWHMNDFAHSFLIVFRIQCGEWIQSMWSCMNTVSTAGKTELIPVCLLIFLGVVFVGNLVVLNLFLALLLNSFSGADLNGGGGNSGAKKFIKSLKRAKKSLSSKTGFAKARIRKSAKGLSASSSSSSSLTKSEYSNCSPKINRDVFSNGDTRDEERMTTNNNANINTRNSSERSLSSDSSRIAALKAEASLLSNKPSSKKRKYRQNEHQCSDLIQVVVKADDVGLGENAVEIKTSNLLTVPQEPMLLQSRYIRSSSSSSIASSANKSDASSSLDNTPEHNDKIGKSKSDHSIDKRGKCNFSHIQSTMHKIVTNWIFETFIIFCIMCSSIALAFEDVNLPLKPTLKHVLEVCDKIFMAVFLVEMIMKWIGFGLKKYFTNGWCILDFFIVVVSIVSLSLEIYAMTSDTNSADISSLRVLRSLRAFRPLRAMSRFKGIKVVTDALFRSIPSIVNVFAICVVFWLIFAIMGVNLFAGKMASCRWKETGEKVWHPMDFKNWNNLSNHFERPPIEVWNKTDCEELADITNGKVYWRNLFVNFDNVGIAYISLMQVATFKGWMPIMYAAVDVPERIGEQPIYENAVENYFFFVAFIILGAFFSLNLFISVVIDNFNQQKGKFEYDGGQLFLTDSQQRAYDMMKKLTARTPSKLIPIPRARWRRRLYFFVTGDKFELAVMVATLLNLAVLAIEHDGINQNISQGMEYVNYAFLVIFSIEITVRIVASGCGFFRVPWNVFDFLVIGASVLVNVVSLVKWSIDGSSAIKSPWLPMLRMIRVARILRVARVASGIRTLLFALMLSLPALVNVGSLLFLFVFIYAIFGMSQFGNVEHKGAITDILNFETFPNAFMLLFQMSTSAGWDGFLEPTLYVDDSQGDCRRENGEDSATCMSTSFVGYFYFTSYLILTFVIITNMYIAIILENFDLANKDSSEPLTADDFEHYFDVWQKYDKDGSGKVTIEQLSSVLHTMDRPLRMEKPNMEQIAQLQIPMDENNRMHIMDVATSLIKKILGPYQFTEEMKCEVHAHFRKKAKRLMRNYSQNQQMTTFEYAAKKLSLNESSASEGGTGTNTSSKACNDSEGTNSSELIEKNSNENQSRATEISIILHTAHDDVRTASLLHSVVLSGGAGKTPRSLPSEGLDLKNDTNFNSNSCIVANAGSRSTDRKKLSSGFYHKFRKMLLNRFAPNRVEAKNMNGEEKSHHSQNLPATTVLHNQYDNLAFMKDNLSIPGSCWHNSDTIYSSGNTKEELKNLPTRRTEMYPPSPQRGKT